MSRKQDMPSAPKYGLRGNLENKFSPQVLDYWNQAIKASDEDENTIGIYDPIGYDYWSDGGVTAKRISAALRLIGKENDVVVNINSPGGDVFEGLAIYNLLREHKGKVTVRVLGLAASAASFIAMAADEIQIARAGFFMIHNAWTVAWGNRHDLAEVESLLGQIDETIADIYHIRTGLDVSEISKQMDAETWINGKNAVEQGFADSFLDSDATITEDKESKASNSATRTIDMLLSQLGLPRSQRRSLLQDLKSGTQDATENSTQDATDQSVIDGLLNLRTSVMQGRESV